MVKLIKGHFLFLAIAACLAITMGRFHFHPLSLFFTITFLIYLHLKFKSPLSFLSLIVILIYLSTYFLTESQNQTKLNEGEYQATGTVNSTPVIDGNYVKGIIKTEIGEKLTYSYLIKSLEEKNSLQKIKTGDVCVFKGELEGPKSPTMPNAFDYKQYLHDHHIHWEFKIADIHSCHAGDFNVMTLLQKYREKGLTLIEEKFPSSSEGIVQALLFGERRLLDEKVEVAYQKLGIVHLLAISGLHVGLLVGGAYFLFIYLGITHENSKKILIILLPVYMILTGGSPSVIRASFMVVLYFIIGLVHKKFTATDVISFTCLVLLLINPYYLFQVGFQLSYIVSLGLLLSSKVISLFSNAFVRLFIVSAVAQLCAMPLILYHFFEVSLISLPLNMIFVPFYSICILPLSILATVLVSFSSTLGMPLVSLLHIILDYSHRLVLNAANISFTTLTTGKPSLFFIILYCMTSIVLFLRFEKNPTLKSLYKPFCGLLLLFFIHLHLSYINPQGRVMVINVGQGDSIFIQLPFNKGNFLIDTGGKMTFPSEDWELRRNVYSIAEDTTIPYLKSIGVTKLHGIFLSHGDLDHIGEALRIINKLNVDELVIPKGFIRGELENEIVKIATEKKMNIRVVEAGDQLLYKGFMFRILSPSTLTDSKNDDSMVLVAEIGGLKWLFTGDAEMKSEEKMMLAYPNLKVDVLKIGHHGSRGSTSDQLLDQLRPSIAIISAGYQNRYQHPHDEVMEKLRRRQISIFRTDLQGGILYEYKGNAGTFFTHPPYDEVK